MSYQEAYAEFLRTNKNAHDPAIAFVAGWNARMAIPNTSGYVSQLPNRTRRNDEHDPRIWED